MGDWSLPPLPFRSRTRRFEPSPFHIGHYYMLERKLAQCVPLRHCHLTLSSLNRTLIHRVAKVRGKKMRSSPFRDCLFFVSQHLGFNYIYYPCNSILSLLSFLKPSLELDVEKLMGYYVTAGLSSILDTVKFVSRGSSTGLHLHTPSRPRSPRLLAS